MTASAIGKTAPPPRPCSPRARMNCPHLLAEAGEHRRHEEEPDRPDEDRAAAVEIRQLAVDRAADRRGQQVDRERPRVQLLAVELGGDDRQRRAHDGLVEGEQEQREHDRAENLEALAIAEMPVVAGILDGSVGGRRVRHHVLIYRGGVAMVPSTAAERRARAGRPPPSRCRHGGAAPLGAAAALRAPTAPPRRIPTGRGGSIGTGMPGRRSGSTAAPSAPGRGAAPARSVGGPGGRRGRDLKFPNAPLEGTSSACIARGAHKRLATAKFHPALRSGRDNLSHRDRRVQRAWVPGRALGPTGSHEGNPGRTRSDSANPRCGQAEGSPVSCRIRPGRSNSCQCSVTLPSRIRKTWISSIE
jgi:hypothetical protein